MEVSSSVKSMVAATGSLSETTGPAAPAKTRGGGGGGAQTLLTMKIVSKITFVKNNLTSLMRTK